MKPTENNGTVFDQEIVTARASALLQENGLHGWQFKWDTAVRRMGSCDPWRKRISISLPIAQLNPMTETIETLLHEIAHALVPDENHSPHWRATAIRLGATGKACGSPHVKIPLGKLEAQCQFCGKLHYRQMPTKKLLYCRCQSYLGKSHIPYGSLRFRPTTASLDPQLTDTRLILLSADDAAFNRLTWETFAMDEHALFALPGWGNLTYQNNLLFQYEKGTPIGYEIQTLLDLLSKRIVYLVYSEETLGLILRGVILFLATGERSWLVAESNLLPCKASEIDSAVR